MHSLRTAFQHVCGSVLHMLHRSPYITVSVRAGCITVLGGRYGATVDKETAAHLLIDAANQVRRHPHCHLFVLRHQTDTGCTAAYGFRLSNWLQGHTDAMVEIGLCFWHGEGAIACLDDCALWRVSVCFSGWLFALWRVFGCHGGWLRHIRGLYKYIYVLFVWCSYFKRCIWLQESYKTISRH